MSDIKKEFYLGIDLGTTNSLISWSTKNHKGEIVTEVLNMDMLDITGSVKSQLLPSFIYFDEKNMPIIGKKAKSMLSRQPDRVIKNAKSFMGSSYVFKIGNREINPVEASAMILKYIGKAVEKQFGKYPENVVITVPASFDTDKRLATIKAAELAGFKTKDENGRNLEILLSEPRAALYDYVNLQNKNEIPDTIDFKTPKTVVVFDLGGGTLDVSIHNLVYNKHGAIEIRDMGVSRYTEVGGIDFDKTLGEFMLQRFIDKNGINNLEQTDLKYLQDKFSEFAEEIKIDLNSQIENEKLFGFGMENLDDIEAEIFKTSIFNECNFTFKVTLKEYKEIVKELLTPELKLENLKNFNEIKESENIIYPILDALKKAESKAGEVIHIDAVILNGGMTKFFPILERVEEFFGIRPHSVLDQDKSVARGASVFNYRISNGEKFEKIQNDTIGIERSGGLVHHLIEAGTVLPVKKIISDFVIPNDQISIIDLPFYLGTRVDTQHPNRKIAERRICFDKPMNRGEKVFMEIQVDELGIMEIIGKAGNSGQKFTVTIEANGNSEKEIEEQQNIETDKKLSEKFIPTGDIIDIDIVMREYSSYCNIMDKTSYQRQKEISMGKIKEIERIVLNSVNGREFAENLILKYKNFSGLLKDRVTYLFGIFGRNYPELKERIFKIFIKNISIDEFIGLGNHNLTKALNGYIRFSLEGLRKIEGELYDEDLLTMLANNPILASVQSSLIMSIGAICKGEQALQLILKAVEDGSNEAYYWSLGKFGSREKKERVPILKFEKIVLEIAEKLEFMSKREILRNAIYSLAEICDRRNSKDTISSDSAKKILSALEKITIKDQGVLKILEIAKIVIQGEKLTETQNKFLLDLRVFL